MIVDVVVVVNIVDGGDVRDPRIADVHVAEITATHSVPRDERFTVSKWAPAKASTESEAEVHTPAWAAKPCD
jgi:hypothetical protein